MKIYQELNAVEFLHKNEELLLKNESENNLILGLSERFSKTSCLDEEPLFITITDQDNIIGQALRSSPSNPLILTRMDDKYIGPFITELKKRISKLHGVVGPSHTAKTFTSIWNSNSKVSMYQGLYELRSVIHPDYNGGTLRLAENEDFDIVKKFSLAFIQDCFPGQDNEEEAVKGAENNIKNKKLFLWQNNKGEIVSMAANSRNSRNGATLSWVYTPLEHRGHGYASKVVAALSQKMLDNGKKFCNLYTDLLNPTSNSIYQKVGYQKIGESIHFDFKI